MNIGFVKTAATAARAIGGKMLFKMRKASPELLIVGGVACIIGGTVVACKATKKANEALDHCDATCEEIREGAEIDRETLIERGGDEKAIASLKKTETKHLMMAKMDAAKKLIIAYAPAAALGGLGIAMIIASHGIMKQRNALLMAAYNALDTAHRNYRERVKEELGEEKDREFALGARRKEVNYIEMDEDGNGRQVKEDAYVFDERSGSPYTADFNSWSSPLYSQDPSYNLLTLRCAESEMCDLLRLQGHLFLNEVLDRLRLDRTPEGQRVGWIYDPSNPDHNGDCYVDFGLCDGYVDAGLFDVDTFKKNIRLNFNCDGEIWDKI